MKIAEVPRFQMICVILDDKNCENAEIILKG